MRVLFFNYEYPPLGGGAAHANAQIFAQFSRWADIDIDLVTSALDGTYSVENLSDRIRIHRIPIGKNAKNLHYQSQKELLAYTWRALKYTRQLLKENAYDMTHSFFAVPCGILSLYCKLLHGLPYIVSLRGADVPGYSERFSFVYALFTPLIVLIWRQAQYCITNSKGLTELAQKTSARIDFTEIYNGIDGAAFEQEKKHVSGERDVFTILCAARLTYRKGFQYALDAVHLLIADIGKKDIKIQMVIAGGDGGMMSRLRGQVQALGLEKHVTFSGQYTREMAPEVYAGADVFLMPSFNEGMSNNVLEALASGLPILMTPTGGAQELVRDGENGYIVDYMSSQNIANRLQRMIEDPIRTVQMGQESRNIAQELTWKKTAQAYYTRYKEVCYSTQNLHSRK